MPSNVAERYLDVVIIGAGPAGLTAARVVASSGLSCLLIDRMGPGGELMNMGEIHDCPDIETGTSGPDFLAKLLDDAMAAGAELVIDEVTGLTGERPWRVVGAEATVTSRAVIIATGLEKGTMGLAEEADFEGRGLSHCANCDGPLFAGKRVVVDGGGDWAIQDAIELAGSAAHVTVITESALRASSARSVTLQALPNVTVVTGAIVQLSGDPVLTKIIVETTTGRTSLDADGLFPCARRKPATAFLGDLLQKARAGHIEVGAIDLQASQSGVFACGDVEARSHRICDAIADGEKAGHNAACWVRSVASGS